jgi:hypothetical protein
MTKWTNIVYVDAIEGYLTNGKEYESQGIESYAGHVVVTYDNNREGNFKPERLVEAQNVTS